MARVSQLVLLSLALTSTGCHGSRALQVEDSPPIAEETVEVFSEGTLIFATPAAEAGAVRVMDHDVHSLYEEANDYLRADDYENALRLYDLLLSHFRDEEYVRVSLYNSALCLEGLGRHDEAAERYALVIEAWPTSEDALHASLRRAESLAHIPRWEDVVAEMDTFVRRNDLSHAERVEGELRRANALFELERWTDAEAAYRNIHRLQNAARARASDDPRMAPLRPSDALVAQAHFGRGRVLHELFLELRFVMPEDRFQRDLVAKGQMLEETRTAYMEAVRAGNRYWSPAAGFMIGQLYEDFYMDVLATEVPGDFSSIEQTVYFEEMRERLRPALRQAQLFYRETLSMVYRIQGDSLWAEKLVDAIERLERYSRTRDGWDEEHDLILQGIHPRDASEPNGPSRMDFPGSEAGDDQMDSSSEDSTRSGLPDSRR